MENLRTEESCAVIRLPRGYMFLKILSKISIDNLIMVYLTRPDGTRGFNQHN